MKVYGLQQVGLGVLDVEVVCHWYAQHLGFTVKAFDDHNPATDMAPFMGGKPRSKRAVLLLHPNGGGGLEIWQYTGRQPTTLNHLAWGQPGINAVGIACASPEQAAQRLLAHGGSRPSFPVPQAHAVSDPWGNLLILQAGNRNAGVTSVYLGCRSVSETEAFLTQTGLFASNGSVWHAREPSTGKFGAFLGDFQLHVLSAAADTSLPHLFHNRYWGDCGWIHWCLDIADLSGLVTHMESQQHAFDVVVDRTFEMGEAHGKWGYLQSPDGTLLECVETLAVPLVPKWGLKWRFGSQTDRPFPRLLQRAFLGSHRLKQAHD